MADIPLPKPRSGWVSEDHYMTWYEVDQMRSHAAAVSAADNATLRADNIRLQNEVVGPLRERVRVLEGVLHEADDAFLSVNPFVPNGSDADFVLQAAWANARAALGDKS